MRLEQRALRRDRRARHVGDHLHRVRVAHRQDARRRWPPCTFSFSKRPARDGAAHVHRHLAVGLQPRRISPPSVSTRISRFAVRPCVHELHEAARAVAALLDLAAVGVEDAVAEVDARPRGLDHQDLVAAHAEMAVGDALQLGAISVNGSLVKSRTTKSFPAPCILVNASFTAAPRRGRDAVDRGVVEQRVDRQRSTVFAAASARAARHPVQRFVRRLLVQRHRIEDRARDAFLGERFADRVAPLAADGELVVDVPAARVLRGARPFQLLAVALRHAPRALNPFEAPQLHRSTAAWSSSRRLFQPHALVQVRLPAAVMAQHTQGSRDLVFAVIIPASPAAARFFVG